MKSKHPLIAKFIRTLTLLIVPILLFPTLAFANATEPSSEHVVQPGETLLQIAVDYDVTIAALLQANDLADADLVRIGQTLLIPSAAMETILAESSDLVAAEVAAAMTDQSVSKDDFAEDVLAENISGDPAYVIVQPGETLSQIALRYGMNSTTLMVLNGLSDPNLVQSWQRLRVADADGNVTAMADLLPTWATNKVHIVQPGESLGQIAELYDVKLSILMRVNHLQGNGWVEVGQKLRIPELPQLDLADVDYRNAPATGQRLLEVDLTEQWMTAWDGKKVFMHTLISSGLADTPTILGHYNIYLKIEKQDMNGFNGPLPDVPWVMYFFDGFSFHGAYWHNNFGIPMSHGCVHLTPEQAKELYEWADVGTAVYVHW